MDDEVGLPFLEPVSGGRGGGGDEEVVKNQAVISISYQVSHSFALLSRCLIYSSSLQDWSELKDALDISKAAIVHPEDLRNK